ncbi:hypothetical protein [Actinocorallia longicatena]|uniref:hypothetical protein n=1 Tax=Actinocorallia longicatena TaxID=111803 RepID=UPI0031DCB2BC
MPSQARGATLSGAAPPSAPAVQAVPTTTAQPVELPDLHAGSLATSPVSAR